MTENGRSSLVVLGGGSLTRSVCYGLSVVATAPLDVTVAARSVGAAAEICQIAAVRAAAHRNPVTFRPRCADLAADGPLADLLAAVHPEAVLLCASIQSPWEGLDAPSEWTRWLGACGIGPAMPFHAQLARRTGRAVAAASPGTVFLNACLPDIVNPVLLTLGVPVLTGIGNVAVLAAAIQTVLGLPHQSDLTVLAHHAHLHEPEDGAAEARAFHRGRSLRVRRLLAAQRTVSRREANRLTGHLTAVLLRDMLVGHPVDTHLPGPRGLPGGYPVHVDGTTITLRLPDGLAELDARRLNQAWAPLDGVYEEDGWIRFTAPVAERIAEHLPGLGDGFPVTRLPDVAHELDGVRTVLRRRPSS